MRRGVVVAAGVAVLLACAGTGWAAVRPPDQSVAVPGTDVRLLADPAVPEAEVEGVVAGLTAVASVLSSDGMPRVPVEARISWRTGCRWYLGPESVSTAWVDGQFLCLNAGHRAWRAFVPEQSSFPAYVSAHEYAHTAQATWGCSVEPEDHQWLWLFEGMADHLAFLALEDAGLVDEHAAQRRIVDLGGYDSSLEPLSAYEVPREGTGEAYPLFHAGAREATAGMDPAEAVAAFRGFCTAAGGGTPWREAFREHFGRDVDDVYQAVADERRRAAT